MRATVTVAVGRDFDQRKRSGTMPERDMKYVVILRMEPGTVGAILTDPKVEQAVAYMGPMDDGCFDELVKVAEEDKALAADDNATRDTLTGVAATYANLCNFVTE